MSDSDERRFGLACILLQHVEHAILVARIEVPRRLVGEQEIWLRIYSRIYSTNESTW